MVRPAIDTGNGLREGVVKGKEKGFWLKNQWERNFFQKTVGRGLKTKKIGDGDFISKKKKIEKDFFFFQKIV